jgi:hypothetical protein
VIIKERRPEMTKVVTGVRRWAAGALTDEAAVELLVCRFGGRYARSSWPWVRPCRAPGWWWLDGRQLAWYAARVSGERQRVLLLAARLVDGDETVPEVDTERRAAA